MAKKEKTFKEAFAANRKAGKKEFTWNNKKYHTYTKEEEESGFGSTNKRGAPARKKVYEHWRNKFKEVTGYQKGGKKVDGTTNRKGNTKGVLGDTKNISTKKNAGYHDGVFDVTGYHNAGVAQMALNKFNQNTLVGKALKKASPEKIAQRKADKAAAKKAGMSVFNYKKSKKVTKKKLGGFRDSFLEAPIEEI